MHLDVPEQPLPADVKEHYDYSSFTPEELSAHQRNHATVCRPSVYGYKSENGEKAYSTTGWKGPYFLKIRDNPRSTYVPRKKKDT